MSAKADNGVSRPSSLVRRIAMMNQKGGVGKTTTTVNLAAGIAERGRPTLVIDLDPQAHASLHLGVDASADHAGSSPAENAPRSVYDLLLNPDQDPAPAIRAVSANLSILPAETGLAGLESELADIPAKERIVRLRKVLARLDERYEFVLMDCPPSLGVLTLNGLCAAQEVFIPMQAHFLALQGVGKLLETVQLVSRSINPGLRVSGVILCMHDASTTHSREVVSDLIEFFEKARSGAGGSGGTDTPWRHARLLEPPIRRNIKLAECPSFGKTIFDYAPWCPGALDYRALAEGVVVEWDAALATRKRDKDAPSRGYVQVFVPPRDASKALG